MTDEIAAEQIGAGRRRHDEPKRRGWLVFLRDMLVILLIAVLVSFLVKTFLVRSFFIPSGSMENTLLINDRILVDELTPRWTGYHRGDVVVFKDPGGWLPAAPPQPPRSPLLGRRRLGPDPRRARRRPTATTTSSSASSGCPATTWCAATPSGRSPSTALRSTSRRT